MKMGGGGYDDGDDRFGTDDRFGDRTFYSEMGLNGEGKANAALRHDTKQAGLKDADDAAMKRGDRFEAADCRMRRFNNDAYRNAGLANDNANRAVSLGREDEHHARLAERNGFVEQMEKIEKKHAEFCARSGKDDIGRKFNSLNNERGEDPLGKAAWERKQADVRANGPGQAQRDAPMAKLDIVKAKAKERAEQEAANGQPGQGAPSQPDQGRTEVPGSQRRNQKAQAARMQDGARDEVASAQPKPAKTEAEVQAELKQGVREAEKVGDHAKYRDCDMRLSHMEAKKEGDVSQQDKLEKQHQIFREDMRQATGREFNSLSTPQGENAQKKDAWDKQESTREFYTEAHLSPSEKADALKVHQDSQEQLRTEARAAGAQGDAPTEFDRWERHNHADVTRNAGLANDKAMEAERNGNSDQADQHRAKRNIETSTADNIAGSHASFRERTKERTGRQFNDLSEAPGEKKQPKTQEERAQWLKNEGATNPGFINYASKSDRNFADAQGLYEQRNAGFEANLARSKGLAAQQSNRSQEERLKPTHR